MARLQENLTIDSRLEATIEARHWAAKHARAAAFDADAIFAIELAIGEALVNVIRHAYKNQPGYIIELTLTINGPKFEVHIRDFGQKFATEMYQPPELGVAREGGYGIYLIEQVMDQVLYLNPAGAGTELHLVKYQSNEAGKV